MRAEGSSLGNAAREHGFARFGSFQHPLYIERNQKLCLDYKHPLTGQNHLGARPSRLVLLREPERSGRSLSFNKDIGPNRLRPAAWLVLQSGIADTA